MKIADVTRNAFAMPFTSPPYPKGPYRFVNREFFTIIYRTIWKSCALWCLNLCRSSTRS